MLLDQKLYKHHILLLSSKSLDLFLRFIFNIIKSVFLLSRENCSIYHPIRFSKNCTIYSRVTNSTVTVNNGNF